MEDFTFAVRGRRPKSPGTPSVRKISRGSAGAADSRLPAVNPAEFRGGRAIAALEQSIETGDVAEARSGGDVQNGSLGLYQQVFPVSQPLFAAVVVETDPKLLPEQSPQVFFVVVIPFRFCFSCLSA